jgi:hypothetical protein
MDFKVIGYEDGNGIPNLHSIGMVTTIKGIRSITNLGLKEGKDFVESLPGVLYGKTMEDLAVLHQHGVKVEIIESSMGESLESAFVKLAQKALDIRNYKLALGVLQLADKYDCI